MLYISRYIYWRRGYPELTLSSSGSVGADRLLQCAALW